MLKMIPLEVKGCIQHIDKVRKEYSENDIRSKRSSINPQKGVGLEIKEGGKW